MSCLESNIGQNPIVNLMSGFIPSSGTPVGSAIMSSIGFPFGWNCNSGASVTNLIGSVPPSSGLP